MERSDSPKEIAELMQNAAWIQTLAYATLGDHALAEDVTQDVLLKALKGEKRTGPVLRSWLAAVTRNLSNNQLRTASRRRKREARIAKPDCDSAGHEQADTLLAHRQLLEAVEALPLEQRNIIVMRFFQERSFEHIAKSLAITPGNARVRLHRALQTLRDVLTARNNNWRHLCLGLAPMPWQPSKPLASSTALMSGMALVLVMGFLWWSVAYDPQPNRIHQEGEFAVETPTLAASEGTPPDQVISSITRATWVKENNLNQGAKITLLEGVIFAKRKPISGVTVSCWQAGELRQLRTDSEGQFSFPINASLRAQITAKGQDSLRTHRWDPGGSRRILIDLWEPPESKLFLRVVEAKTKTAIPNAKVQIWLDYTGGDRGTSRHQGLTKLLAEGETRQDGTYLGQSWLRGASSIIKVNAPGFHPNVGTTWGASRAAAEVALVKGDPLPIQLLSSQGEPYANTVVDSGLFWREELTTNDQGILPVPAEWTLASVNNEAAALPSRLKLKLKDGRIWQANARTWTSNEIHVLEDRIQLVVETKAIRVQLGEVQIPEHHWIEVRCADYVSHDWIAEDVENMWQRVEPGQLTTLSQG